LDSSNRVSCPFHDDPNPSCSIYPDHYHCHACGAHGSRLDWLLEAEGAPGDRVTLYAPNSWEWLVSYYGTAKTGAVINPINVMLTPPEVAYVMRDCGAKVLVGSRDKLAAVPDAGTADLTAIVFGRDPLSGAVPFDEIVSKRASFEPVTVEPEQLSTICYTSGTTGHPKGACQSHRAVILNCAMTAQMWATTAADTVVSALPNPHIYGNLVFNTAMMYGPTLVLHPRFDASEALGSIEVSSQARAGYFCPTKRS
jgi:long-chain acyl-CoA synthetase